MFHERIKIFAVLSALLTYVRTGEGYQLANTTRLDAVRPQKKFRASLVSMANFSSVFFGITPQGGTDSRQSAYAIVNPSSSDAAKIDLVALDSRGNTACATSLTIPPLNRISKFASELLFPCNAPGIGSVIISSTLPIAVGALEVSFPEGKFSDSLVVPID